MPATRDRIISTAVNRFRTPPGHAREDMIQEGWVALLIAEPLFDPERHRCTLAAFLVVRIRSHLSRLVRRAARGAAGQLPHQVAAKDHTPADEAIFNEGVKRRGGCV